MHCIQNGSPSKVPEQLVSATTGNILEDRANQDLIGTMQDQE